MGPIYLLILVAFGFLVMLQVIPRRRVGRYFGLILALMIFGPVLVGLGTQQGQAFLAQPHPWWVYLIFFFGGLLLLRLILNFLNPLRRR